MFALVQAGQAKGRQMRLEEADRVRVEGRNQSRSAFRPGSRDGAPDHRLVTGMKSIEIAKRDDAAAQGLRDRRAAVQPLHWVPIGKGRSGDNHIREAIAKGRSQALRRKVTKLNG